MPAKSNKRKNCRLCNSEMLIKAISLKNIPISDVYHETAEESLNAERYPIDIYQCLECLHIQQLDVVEAESLWSDYTYFSGNTPNMPKHFKDEYADIITSYGGKLGKKAIIEVGSNDGTFLKLFQESGWNVLGIDPAPGPAERANQQGVHTIPSFFGKEVCEKILAESNQKPSVILMYNAFAHMDNVQEVLESIGLLLDDTQPSIFRFEVQYAKSLVENCLIPSIFHEHISHYSLMSLSRFLDRYGMYIIDAKTNHIQHGSLVVTSAIKKHREVFGQTRRLKELLIEEAKSGSVYLNGLKRMNEKINNKIRIVHNLLKDKDSNKIAGYGAARSASTIITQLDIRKFISVVFEENKHKIGKYIYGEGIEIAEPNKEKLENYDIIVVLAWVHSAHIEKKLQEYIARGGQVITLFPQIKSSSANGENYLD
jgi:hypothetical protein